MSTQLLDTPAPHPWSLTGLADNAWNAFLEAAVWATKGPAGRAAESVVLGLMQNITSGHLRVCTQSGTYDFPSAHSTSAPEQPNAEIRVLSDTFWIRLCLMGDLGFAEAYMYGEVECDDLVSLFKVFLLNKSKLERLDSKMSYLFALPQKLTSYRFLNTLSNSRSNISAHYDISNDMFQGFLSQDMTYSCAIFPELDGDLDMSTIPTSRKLTNAGSRSVAARKSQTVCATAGSTTTAEACGENDSDDSDGSSLGSLVDSGIDVSNTPQDDASKAAHRVVDDLLIAHAKLKLTSTGRRQHFTSEEEERAVENEEVDVEVEDELYLAQLRKLDHIIDKLKIPKDRPTRVLEIGSGWGSMAMRIAERYPLATVDTLTLSVQQQALARTRIAERGSEVERRIRVHLMDYRAMPAEWEASFDRVVSVEMIEAVGKEFLEVYWGRVEWAMKREEAVGVVQVITLPEARFEKYVSEIDFIRKWFPPVFPGGLLPTVTLLTQSLEAGSEGRLVIDSISNIGPHYARTLREWRHRFLEQFDAVIRPALMKEYPTVMGTQRPDGDMAKASDEIEVFKRKWIYYYCYCEVGFTTRTLGDHIITFIREGYQDYGCDVYE